MHLCQRFYFNAVISRVGQVIVMEYCSGFKVTDTQSLDHHNVDREALMKRICQAYAAQVCQCQQFPCVCVSGFSVSVPAISVCQCQ